MKTMNSKKVLLFFIFSMLTLVGLSSIYAQTAKKTQSPLKVVKEYYDVLGHVKEEYEVDNTTGVKNGYYKTFDYEGRLNAVRHYKMGIEDGVAQDYNLNGQVISIWSMKDGQKNGLSKWLLIKDLKGKAQIESLYDMGNKLEEIERFMNGNIKIKWLNNGICYEFYENGKKKSEWTNKNGYRVGDYRFLFADGKSNQEIRNGKTYNYRVSDSDKKYGYLSSIVYDSLQIHILNEYVLDENRTYSEPAEIRLPDSLSHLTAHCIKNDSTRKAFKTTYKWERGRDNGVDNNHLIVEKYAYKYIDGPINQGWGEFDEKKLIMSITYNEDGKLLEKKEPFDSIGKPKIYKFTNYQMNGKIQKITIGESERIDYAIFFKKFDLNGKITFELNLIPVYNYSDPLNIDKTTQQITYYDLNGKISKIVECNSQSFIDEDGNIKFNYNGVIERTISTNKELGEYQMEQQTFQFNRYSFVKKGMDGSYEYLQGKVLNEKSVKVLNDIIKRFKSAKTDDDRDKLVLEHKATIDKIMQISNKDYETLNGRLKQVNKIEEIRDILGLK